MPEKPGKQFLPAHAEVLANVGEDPGQGSDAQRAVLGDGDVVLALLRRGQAEVAPGLTSDAVAERAERSGEFPS